MKPKWVIEKDMFLDTEETLIRILKEKGYEVKVVNYIPFDDDYSRFEKMFEPEDCVIFYGSLNMAMQLKSRFNWIPGVYADVKKYNVSEYSGIFWKYMLNNQFLYTSYGDLKEASEEENGFYESLFFKQDQIFVRPDSILKEFNGQVVSKYNFKKAVELMGFYNEVNSNTTVLVSSVKDVQKEWRFIIGKNGVISGSLYRVKEKEETLHEPCTDENALKFANEMSKLWQPDDVWVLDVCLSDNEYKVLEPGCFSFAGMYGNDLSIIVDEVSKYAETKHSIYHEISKPAKIFLDEVNKTLDDVKEFKKNSPLFKKDDKTFIRYEIEERKYGSNMIVGVYLNEGKEKKVYLFSTFTLGKDRSDSAIKNILQMLNSGHLKI